MKWKVKRGWRTQPAVDGRGLVGGGVVDDDVHIEALGHAAVDQVEEAPELLGAVAVGQVAMTGPEATSRAAYRLVVP